MKTSVYQSITPKVHSHLIMISLTFGIFLSSHAQSKKEQIELLNFRIDSLKVEFKNEREHRIQLETELKSTKDQLIRKEALLNESNAKLLSNSEKSKLIITELSLTKDSLKILRNELRRITATRDISNGEFSSSELRFLIQEFQSSALFDDPSELVINDSGGEIIIEPDGDSDHKPSLQFTKKYDPSLAGDLDNDGTNEVIFQVSVYGGGSDRWIELYCLKLLPNNNYEINQLETPCLCSGNYSCGEEGVFSIERIQKNLIYVKMDCFLEDDGDCCPSSSADGIWKFIRNTIVVSN